MDIGGVGWEYMVFKKLCIKFVIQAYGDGSDMGWGGELLGMGAS